MASQPCHQWVLSLFFPPLSVALTDKTPLVHAHTGRSAVPSQPYHQWVRSMMVTCFLALQSQLLWVLLIIPRLPACRSMPWQSSTTRIQWTMTWILFPFQRMLVSPPAGPSHRSPQPPGYSGRCHGSCSTSDVCPCPRLQVRAIAALNHH